MARCPSPRASLTRCVRGPNVRPDAPMRPALLVVSLVLLDVLVTSVLYHRSLTHRAVIFKRWLARSLTVYMQGMAFAPPLTWVATHTLHHAHTDTPRDPYSPRVHGFLAVFFG